MRKGGHIEEENNYHCILIIIMLTGCSLERNKRGNQMKNMRKKRSLVTVGLVVLLITLLTACGGKKSIEGKWSANGADHTMEFRNGVYYFDDVEYGTYKITDNEHIEFILDTDTVTVKFILDKDDLTIIDEDETRSWHRTD